MRSASGLLGTSCRPSYHQRLVKSIISQCMNRMQYSTGKEDTSVAIVGGGTSGLSCALELAAKGFRSTIFDMGTRSAGGRCCSRPDEQHSFDHGCQVLTEPTNDAYKQQLEVWRTHGVVKQWIGRFGRLDISAQEFHPWPLETGFSRASNSGGPHRDGFLAGIQPGPLYVGVPSMQSICAHMADQLTSSGRGAVMLSHKVESASWDSEQRVWRLRGSLKGRAAGFTADANSGGEDLGSFKGLVVADSLVCIPGSAGHVALQGADHQVEQAMRHVASIKSDPVFSLMVAFEQQLPGVPFDASVISGGSFQWLACNSSKPGRPGQGPQCWVAVTTPAYARMLMEQFPLHVQGKYNPQTKGYLERVAPVLYAELEHLLTHHLSASMPEFPQPCFLRAQRWGRGFNCKPLGVPCLSAPSQSVAVCGDFCLGPTVEDAWTSGWAAAGEMARALYS